jgi:alkanesulfonate monooxygenase SsuD/methylene tetrahydromethanopterin reductase-like flavin-dependent oxidoreductase (luciferase family)
VRIGAMFRCGNPPETVAEYARRVERLGYAELWVVEDCFYAAAISTATVALTSTERIPVGIGVLPAVLRNPALAAMELSALARVFPGRLRAGFGHGVAEWMKQVGAFPPSQLAALGETVTAVRRLLDGERVSMAGRHVNLDDVALEHPPVTTPPVYTGVRGAKSLALSGEVADGTILVEGSTPSYVKWARERIDEGRRNAGRTDDHAVTVYAIWGQDVAGLGDVEALAEAGADAVIVVPSSDPAAAERELEQAAGTLGLS